MITVISKKAELEQKLKFYEDKLALKMKRYRGVIHESAASEMKHQEVMVLKAMVADLRKEISKIDIPLSLVYPS